MTITGINPQYAIATTQAAQEYPAIQVTDYEPRFLDETISFCLSEESYQLIEDCSPLFNSEIVQCAYNRKSVLMHKIITPVRWVFLNMPPLFAKDKDSKEYSYLQKGARLSDTNKVTAAKCFLLCLVDGKLIKNPDGEPKIFTLNLTSNKTNLIGSKNYKSESKTLVSLNTGLQKHYKVTGNLLHLASVELTVKPKEFQSSQKNTSSMGVMFYLEGNAKALTEEQQQQVFELINDEEIQEIFNDPFHLKQSENSKSETMATANNLIPRTEASPNTAVSHPIPKPVVKTSIESPSPKTVVKTSNESPSVKPSPTKNETPWSKWKNDEDALAWALEQLPEMSMHKLRQEWEVLQPYKFVDAQGIKRESKALAWVERIIDLKIVPF